MPTLKKCAFYMKLKYLEYKIKIYNDLLALYIYILKYSGNKL